MCMWDQKKAATLADLHNSELCKVQLHPNAFCDNGFITLQGLNTPSERQNPCISICGIRWSWELWKKHLNSCGKGNEASGLPCVARGLGGSREQLITCCPLMAKNTQCKASIKAEFGLNEQNENLQTICFNPSEAKVSNNYSMLWRKAVMLWEWCCPSKQGHGQKVLGMDLTGVPPSEPGWFPHTLAWQLSRFHPVLWTQLPQHDNATVLFQGVI